MCLGVSAAPLPAMPSCLLPAATGKGGKNRRRGKNENDSKRELTYKEDGQEYAQVIKMLGNGRLEAYCFDNVSRLCHIRGKLRKRVWIQQGDIILIGLREFQDAKADVIQKYDNDEARSLKAYGELPENGARVFSARPARRRAPRAVRFKAQRLTLSLIAPLHIL